MFKYYVIRTIIYLYVMGWFCFSNSIFLWLWWSYVLFNSQAKSLDEVKQMLRESQLEENRKRELSSALHACFKDWLYGNVWLYVECLHKDIEKFVFFFNILSPTSWYIRVRLQELFSSTVLFIHLFLDDHLERGCILILVFSSSMNSASGNIRQLYCLHGE